MHQRLGKGKFDERQNRCTMPPALQQNALKPCFFKSTNKAKTCFREPGIEDESVKLHLRSAAVFTANAAVSYLFNSTCFT